MLKDEKQIALHLPTDLYEKLQQIRSKYFANQSNSEIYLYLIRIGLDSWDKNRHI